MALKGRPIVGMVANFGSQKDQETLIEAISRVRSIVPDVALLLVGERLVGQSDARIAQLKERIRSLGLEGNVYFAGQWENVAEVIACFDVGVLSSHWEGFGNVVVEYMAMGKPVVATRIGGIPDIIVDGETGYLVEPYHPQGMAERILQLLQDSEMRVRFGSAGRRRAEERFSVDRWAEAMYGTYLEALAGAWQ
ncbi:MAG: glycosyltransferase [candidate division WOR-3 bacterium]